MKSTKKDLISIEYLQISTSCENCWRTSGYDNLGIRKYSEVETRRLTGALGRKNQTSYNLCVVCTHFLSTKKKGKKQISVMLIM